MCRFRHQQTGGCGQKCLRTSIHQTLSWAVPRTFPAFVLNAQWGGDRLLCIVCDILQSQRSHVRSGRRVFTVSVSLQCWLALDAFSLMLLLVYLSLVAWRVHRACTCAFRRTFFSFAGDCTPSLGLPSSLLPSVFPDACCVQKMLWHTLFACLPLSLVSHGDTRLGFYAVVDQHVCIEGRQAHLVPLQGQHFFLDTECALNFCSTVMDG